MIAKSTAGPSFASVARYLAGRTGATDPTRVAWTAARNLPAEDPPLAAELMQATAAQNPRVDVPAYQLTLSFAPEDNPTRQLMEHVADRVLSDLGLAEHQALLVAHHDRQHQHVHVLVNRVHPDTFAPWDRWQDHARLDRVLAALETTHSLRPVPERYERIADRAVSIEQAKERVRTPAADTRPLVARLRELIPDIRAAQSWQELRDRLHAYGVRLERRAHGLVFADGTSHVKASRLAGDTSLSRLEARFGPFAADHAPDAAALAASARSPYEVARTIDGATQRLRHAEWAIERTTRSAADTERALAAVFVDPLAAVGAIARYDATNGAGRIAEALREHPEQFGQLVTLERRHFFGLWTSSDERAARAAAIEAASLVQEWTAHTRQVRDLLQLQPGASGNAVRAALAELRTATADLVTQLRGLTPADIPLRPLAKAVERTLSGIVLDRGRGDGR